jgi:hypothetical protein
MYRTGLKYEMLAASDGQDLSTSSAASGSPRSAKTFPELGAMPEGFVPRFITVRVQSI